MFSGPGLLLAGRQTLGRGSLGTGLWQSPSPPPGALAGLESSVLSPPSMLDNVSAPSCWALTVGHISTRHACTVGSSTNKSLKGAKDGIRAQLLWPLAWLCPAGCHCLPQASFPTGGTRCWSPVSHQSTWTASSSVACADVPGPPAHWGDLSLQHHSLHTECDAWALVFLEHTASHQGLDILSLCPQQPQVPSFLSGLHPHLSILAGLPL